VSSPPKIGVLFLCTGNSARSQMAEALLRHLAGERFEAFSAGTRPKGVHPLTLRVLGEIGVSTEGLRSKHVSDYLGRLRVEHAVMVCDAAAQECPALFPLAGEVHRWPFEDPAGWAGGAEAELEKFREVRDAIRARLERFVAGEPAVEPPG
jgi:arsenate reductase